MNLDYEAILNQYEQEGREQERKLIELKQETESTLYLIGFYEGFSKAMYMLDRIYREHSEKAVEDLFEEGRRQGCDG